MAESLKYTEPEPNAESGLDAFTAALSATESAPAETFMVDEEEADVAEDSEQEIPEAEPSDDKGPSAEFIALAKLAGVPQELIEVAKDNTSVEKLVEFFGKQQQVEQPKEEVAEESEKDDLSIQDYLTEEYDESDPVHRQLRHVIDVVNKQRQEERKALQLLLAHAQHQLQERQQTEAASFQRPYDEALDELDSPAFGNSSRGLTDSQIKLRAAAFKGYISLVDGEPEDRRRDLAKAAIKAKYSSLFPERQADKAVEQRVKQAKRKLGGSTGKGISEALSPEERFARALAEISAGAS